MRLIISRIKEEIIKSISHIEPQQGVGATNHKVVPTDPSFGPGFSYFRCEILFGRSFNSLDRYEDGIMEY